MEISWPAPFGVESIQRNGFLHRRTNTLKLGSFFTTTIAPSSLREDDMDKLNRLQVLTGDEHICGEETASGPSMIPTPKPQYLYEGTDSDDDEVVTSRGRRTLGKENEEFDPSSIQSGWSMRILGLPETNYRCRNQCQSAGIPRL